MVFGALDRRVVRVHAGEHLSSDEHLSFGRQVDDGIDIGRAPKLRDPVQNRVAGKRLFNGAPRALDTVPAMVIHPSLSQHLPARNRPGQSALCQS